MWDVGDMGMWNFEGFKMFRMWDVRDLGCLPGREMLIYKMLICSAAVVKKYPKVLPH